MTSLLERIDLLIEEREYQNDRINAAYDKSSVRVGGFDNLVRENRSVDKHLDEMYINTIIISKLRSLKEKVEGLDREEAEAIITDNCQALRAMCTLYDAEVDGYDLQRKNFREQGLYDSTIRVVLNKNLVCAKYRYQLYHQAETDFDTLIDYMD
ncbi:MAG: hypothetical protein AB3N14_15600 [Flavobacteriaceae bacterium]